MTAKLAPVGAVVLTACALTTAFAFTHRPTKVVTREKVVEVVKEKYVLSPDGRTGDVKKDDAPVPTTGERVVSDWTIPQTNEHYGQGLRVVEVDGQRCVQWSRIAPGFGGDETASGLSCRPISAR